MPCHAMSCHVTPRHVASRRLARGHRGHVAAAPAGLGRGLRRGRLRPLGEALDSSSSSSS
eukprot:6459199-Heterocapsa_arctica.AAC.1